MTDYHNNNAWADDLHISSVSVRGGNSSSRLLQKVQHEGRQETVVVQVPLGAVLFVEIHAGQKQSMDDKPAVTGAVDDTGAIFSSGASMMMSWMGKLSFLTLISCVLAFMGATSQQNKRARRSQQQQCDSESVSRAKGTDIDTEAQAEATANVLSSSESRAASSAAEIPTTVKAQMAQQRAAVGQQQEVRWTLDQHQQPLAEGLPLDFLSDSAAASSNAASSAAGTSSEGV